jgi:type II secretory ATPase GspE/PulE/Tfp pilus assembly ATPase PilB-like protein
LHAATPAGAIARLLEMGVEPYQLTSAIFGIVSQRLLRKRSPRLQPQGHEDQRLKPRASPDASGAPSRYQGRIPVAEFVVMDEPLRHAILNRSDASSLGKIYAAQPGFRPMRAAAGDCIRGGITDEAEVRRVLGTEADGGAPA